MSQHTPEPWTIDDEIFTTNNVASIRQENSYKTVIATVAAYEFYNTTIGEANANAKRIVQCVNACAGIEDPAAYIADLQSRLDLAVKELEELKAKQPKIIMEVDGKTIATFFGEAVLTQIKGGADDTK